MTTTSFFCRKKALWPFPPITLPRPEPFVNPDPQILQFLCRAARRCATVPNLSRCFSADSTLVPKTRTLYDYGTVWLWAAAAQKPKPPPTM